MNHEKLFRLSLFAGAGVLALAALLSFSVYSVDDQIRISYVWSPLILFGLFGRTALRDEASNPLKRAVAGAVGGLVVQTLFIQLFL